MNERNSEKRDSGPKELYESLYKDGVKETVGFSAIVADALGYPWLAVGLGAIALALCFGTILVRNAHGTNREAARDPPPESRTERGSEKPP